MKKLLLLLLPLLLFSGCSLTVNTGSEDAIITLSEDHKSILVDGTIGLSIDHDIIFNFFKTESQLCDESNIDSNPDRKAFCEDKEIFKNMTRFTSIIVSPDKTKVGLTIESDALTPDNVLGIFYPARTTDKVHILTNYYLGNEFIGFSPNSKSLVYKGHCFEALCGLYIKDSENLAEKISLNAPEFLDERTEDIEFIKWITDNTVEYKLGSVIQQTSF